jgi:ATP-dependent DNA ligase
MRDSRYSSGRTNDWVKVTCTQRETLPIAGFALDGNKWDGIYVGRRKGKELLYAGKVDHGFDDESSKILRALLKPLIRPTQPYTKKVAHRGVWVEPELLAEIEYRAKSAEGKLRHPVYKGLRKDLRREGRRTWWADFGRTARRSRPNERAPGNEVPGASDRRGWVHPPTARSAMLGLLHPIMGWIWQFALSA